MTDTRDILFITWQDAQSRRILPIARLCKLGNGYEFAYINAVKEAQELGFEALLSFPDLEVVYRSRELPAVFSNRLMPRSREDYPTHIAELDLAPEQGEPFTVLARSGGRRMTDKLEVFASPIQYGDHVQGLFLARGIRHVPGSDDALGDLQASARLFVMADVQNTANAAALALRDDSSRLLGYVPDYLAGAIAELDAAPSLLEVTVVKVNPHPAPVHHRLLCQFSYPLPYGAELFRGERYQPLSPDATAVAA